MTQNKHAGATDGRGFFDRIGRMTVALLVFAVLAEAVTRVADALLNDVPLDGTDEMSALYTDLPYLYKVPRPNARFGVYEVNSRGFRGRELEMPKPAGVFRVLTLGDSSTWDSNVSGTEATWPVQLEERLNEGLPAGGPRFDVVNGGVPGYTSMESLLNFLWRGLSVDPDAFVLYQGYTDFKPNRFPGFKADYSHFRTRDATSLRALAERSRFLFYARQWISRLKPKTNLAYDDVLEPGLAAFESHLRRIAVVARDAGVQPVFATFAMPLSAKNRAEHPEKFRGMEKNLECLTFDGAVAAHRKYNAAIVKLARELAIPMADVDAAVPKDFEHFTDHCHMSDLGSRRVADVFRRTLLSSLDLPEGLRPKAPAPASNF